TTGAGDITINQPLSSGAAINIAVAPGFGFTNNSTGGFLDFGGRAAAGLDATFANGPIVVLADTMSLAGGPINAGRRTVVLGPATLTNGVALGAAGGAGTLGLLQADFDTIT